MRKVETKYSLSQEELKIRDRESKEFELLASLKSDFSKILTIVVLIFIALITLIASILTGMETITVIAKPLFYMLCFLSVTLSISIVARTFSMKGR